MAIEEKYRYQVQLLIQVMPIIFEEECFALKGGTAINLFVRNMPRLSVDIDLMYLPNEDRTQALENIQAALMRISNRLEKTLRGLTIHRVFEDKADALRLLVDKDNVRIKVELSPVTRGTVYEPIQMQVCELVEEQYGYVEALLVSIPDLYGGKICAALDRQHPRDLFDVKLLLENEGITDEIRKAFLVYLISHRRPIAELLEPKRKDISAIYENEFAGMVTEAVSLQELLDTREILITDLANQLTEDEKKFLLSFKTGESTWELLGLEGVGELPAVRWKQYNLDRMKQENRAHAIENLRKTLYGGA